MHIDMGKLSNNNVIAFYEFTRGLYIATFPV